MLNDKNNESGQKELELLNEKLQRNEKILIQAYKSLKDKELKLKQLNEDLLASEEEQRQTNEKLFEANELLVTQKDQLEIALSELQKTQLQLIQSEKMASLGVLANGIAHEINNPLNFINGGILGLETYFNDHLENHLENVAPLMEAIKTGIVRSANIVRSLDQYSHANRTELINCDIHAIINNCLVLLQSKMTSRIEVVKSYTHIPYNLIGCEGNLLQVFLNIIKNAIQSISDKGTINITTKVEKTILIISIADTGCGITQENLPKIFDPFFTTKDPGKGTGLGLSIAYKIILEHKGTIEYNSELGTGTTASIKLPINI